MQAGGIVGRPPLPEGRKRKNRIVGLFTDDERAEIDEYLARNDLGPNDLIRALVLERVRLDDKEQS